MVSVLVTVGLVVVVVGAFAFAACLWLGFEAMARGWTPPGTEPPEAGEDQQQ